MVKPRAKIMLVDDNITNLTVGKSALNENYDVFTVPSGDKLLRILEKTLPDLILLDVEMPEMNGYEVIRILKLDPRTADIPVIFLTAKSDTGSEIEGLSLGAIDYITKPFSPPLLRKRLEMHLLVESQRRELQNYNDNLQEMVNEKTATVLELQNAVLRTVAELVEYRDSITGGHVERTQAYLRILVDAMLRANMHTDEIASWDLPLFLQSCQLHDVGKIAINDSILKKAGKLTPEEYEQMKKHTTFGVSIIERIEENTTERTFLRHAKVFAGYHHERWDGEGYPYKLAGSDIPLPGRLMAIADVYDALISERPYKKPFTHERAVELMLESKGTHFDPELCDLLVKVAGEFKAVSDNCGT